MDFLASFDSGSGMKENFEDDMGQVQEPDFTKKISSKTICDFFYYFFWAYLVLGGLSFIAMIGTAAMAKVMPWGTIISFGFTFAIAAISALFHYLVCSRALLK
jgi:amino acid transporter